MVKAYGNLTNRIMENVKGEVTVGMGVTMTLFSDRHAGTVIKVTPYMVTVQRDKATRVDNKGISESQSYVYERNPNGEIVEFRKQKNGTYRNNKQGMGLVLGRRDEYYDFSF